MHTNDTLIQLAHSSSKEEFRSVPSHTWETPVWSEQPRVYIFHGRTGHSNCLYDTKLRKIVKRVPAEALEESHGKSNICVELPGSEDLVFGQMHKLKLTSRCSPNSTRIYSIKGNFICISHILWLPKRPVPRHAASKFCVEMRLLYQKQGDTGELLMHSLCKHHSFRSVPSQWL